MARRDDQPRRPAPTAATAQRRPLAAFAWWQALGWLMIAAVVVLCVIPEPPDPVAARNADKLYHLLGYGVLAGWCTQLWLGRALALRLLGLLAMGIGLEGVQALLPWRSAEFGDAVANMLGVVVGGLVALTPLARGLVVVERIALRQRGPVAGSKR